MYRRDEFEFHRLRNSFWMGALMNISTEGTAAAVEKLFPMRALDVGFTRPRVPYACGQQRPHTCGPGTMRTPVKSC
jgi:hypothetical protein